MNYSIMDKSRMKDCQKKIVNTMLLIFCHGQAYTPTSGEI